MYAAEVRRSNAQMESAGVNCAKLVLQNIKEHSSDSSYERKITTAKSMGMEVGTKHHSRMFVPPLRAAMHSVLMKGFTRLLVEPDPVTTRPRPFAELADKATVMRETGQMHGLIVMIDGNLTALFLSVLKAPDSTGNGLAKLLLQSLTQGAPLKLSIALLRLSLCCLAFDGQYQSAEEGHAAGLQVKDRLCELAALSKKWVGSRWDGAHRIELGLDTVREDSELVWYKDFAPVVSNNQTKYLYGKGFDRVKATAERLGSKL
eukprot:3472454-Prymnesium_polylepis.1